MDAQAAIAAFAAGFLAVLAWRMIAPTVRCFLPEKD